MSRGLEEKSSISGENMAASSVVLKKKKRFDVGFECPERISFGEGEDVILCRGAEDRRGMGTTSGKHDTRNLEGRSIRGRMDSTGGCLSVKTVTEIQRPAQRNCQAILL